MLEELFRKIESIAQQPILRQAEAITDIGTRAVEGEGISLEDAWQLLNVDVQQRPELALMVLEAARKKKAQRFDGTVFSISPLYVTSNCREHCT